MGVIADQVVLRLIAEHSTASVSSFIGLSARRW
jgi:hypothetical protein